MTKYRNTDFFFKTKLYHIEKKTNSFQRKSLFISLEDLTSLLLFHQITNSSIQFKDQIQKVYALTFICLRKYFFLN